MNKSLIGLNFYKTTVTHQKDNTDAASMFDESAELSYFLSMVYHLRFLLRLFLHQPAEFPSLKWIQ